jgi:hypothetical protein
LGGGLGHYDPYGGYDGYDDIYGGDGAFDEYGGQGGYGDTILRQITMGMEHSTTVVATVLTIMVVMEVVTEGGMEMAMAEDMEVV